MYPSPHMHGRHRPDNGLVWTSKQWVPAAKGLSRTGQQHLERNRACYFCLSGLLIARNFNTGPLVEPILTGRPTSNAPIRSACSSQEWEMGIV